MSADVSNSHVHNLDPQEQGHQTGTPLVLGDVDGVTVSEFDGDHGFAVKFPFDRRLSNLLVSGVKDAKFDEQYKEYMVPAAQAEALGKTVVAMRKEVRLANAELAKIRILATQSGRKMMDEAGVPHDDAYGPNVSEFVQPGEFYRGPVINANSRFVAQSTGLGQDGTAFVKIHKLSALDNPNIMKGDKISVVYDNKFTGQVNDASQYKSASDLQAEFEIQQGTEVDGVMLTNRGDKIGIAFEMNPVLAARIRRVETAAFNREERVWEVSKEYAQYALIAADDMRKEFVVDAQDVALLKDFAESKIDGSKVNKAFTKDGVGHSGPILEIGERYALQKVGRDNFTLHHLSAFKETPEQGNVTTTIRYDKGVANVHVKDMTVAKGNQR